MAIVAPVALDRCWFTPTLGGLTDFVVSAALTGYQTPAQAGAVNGAVYSYFAQSADLTQWEYGTGTYVVSTTTLQRTVINASSNSNAKVNFSVVPSVAIDARGEDIQNLADLLHAFAGGI